MYKTVYIKVYMFNSGVNDYFWKLWHNFGNARMSVTSE